MNEILQIFTKVYISIIYTQLNFQNIMAFLSHIQKAEIFNFSKYYF